jgi:nucleoside-diphosphate-sugar epimerase
VPVNSEHTILVTGSAGYIGKSTCRYLRGCGKEVLSGVRSMCNNEDVGKNKVEINLNDLSEVSLVGVDIVVHLAGLAHSRSHAHEDFMDVNYSGTVRLAEEAMRSGVKRFIFISSIGVNGTSSSGPISEGTSPQYNNSYAESKFFAEKSLFQMCQDPNSTMDVVVIRPPLVYGVDAPGNVAKLKNAVSLNIPLPFGNVRNKRHFCSIANLMDFISLCCDLSASKRASNNLFLIADDDALSTPDLVTLIGKINGKSAKLFPVPVFILRFFFRLISKGALEDSLIENFEVSNNKALKVLGWRPIYSPARDLSER